MTATVRYRDRRRRAGRPGAGPDADAVCARHEGRAARPPAARGAARRARLGALGWRRKRAFEALGLWDALAAEAEPVRAMKITDSGTGDIARPLFLKFEGDVAPGEPFAHMVPNRLMNAALIEALEDQVDGARAGRDHRLLGRPGEARADAEGRPRGLRRRWWSPSDGAQLGAARHGRDRHDRATTTSRSGVVTTIGHELPHEGVAYEHFRPAGPVREPAAQGQPVVAGLDRDAGAARPSSRRCRPKTPRSRSRRRWARASGSSRSRSRCRRFR